MSVNILNLSGYVVSDIRETDHDYHIDAEVSNPPDACKYCQNTHVVSYGRVDRTIRDLPVHAKRVAIYLASQRYRCRACKKTFVETQPRPLGRGESPALQMRSRALYLPFYALKSALWGDQA